jgi:predicted DNA-binding ribbon-helix-helix protein
MRPDEWTALDALAEKTNLSRGELVAKLVLRQTARH